ncbi:hypothetical protein GGI10_006133, partial [Coemansia sp. RSA 2530]
MSICVGSMSTTIFCDVIPEPAKGSSRPMHDFTTTTTTLTVEYESTSTREATRSDFFVAANTPISLHSSFPAHAPISSTKDTVLAVLDSPHVLSPPLNQFLTQLPASSSRRAAHQQPTRSHVFAPVSQPPPATEIAELSQQPMPRSPVQRQQTATRDSGHTVEDIPIVTSKVHMAVFSSPIMTIARPATEITWITKTTWVLKPLSSQPSSVS